MPKKRKSAPDRNTVPQVSRSLPRDLEDRLQAVWQILGPMIDWCDSCAAWMQAFGLEARPYRETFYWESIARMVSDFLARHPGTRPGDALSNCLIATQCPPCADDPAALKEFHSLWQQRLHDARAEIDAFIEADLALAKQHGNYELVKTLYEGDQQAWEKQ
jgi:hypothetical protein